MFEENSFVIFNRDLIFWVNRRVPVWAIQVRVHLSEIPLPELNLIAHFSPNALATISQIKALESTVVPQ